MLPTVRGHAETLQLLGRAVARGDLAQSILLHGQPGVGKERVGLWLAQLIVCENRGDGVPCGECQPCRLALGLQHPDIHWFFPLPRPDASSPEKLRDKLEESRGEQLAARRAEPHLVPSYDRPPAHYLASVRTMQQLASVRPSMGSSKVFVIGDAEYMVPQEASQEAANAFLKLLEEPPADTVLILTSSQPGALLPTIRSRVLPLRLAPLQDDEIADYLHTEMGIEPAAAAAIAARARGSLGRAIRSTPAVDGGSGVSQRRETARQMLLAALSAGPVPRLGLAHDRPPAGARGDLLNELDALADWLRDLLAIATGAAEAVPDADARTLLQRAVDKLGITPLAVGRALEYVDAARKLAEGNVNPQLIVADLLRRMQAELRPEAPKT